MAGLDLKNYKDDTKVWNEWNGSQCGMTQTVAKKKKKKQAVAKELSRMGSAQKKSSTKKLLLLATMVVKILCPEDK